MPAEDHGRGQAALHEIDEIVGKGNRLGFADQAPQRHNLFVIYLVEVAPFESSDNNPIETRVIAHKA